MSNQIKTIAFEESLMTRLAMLAEKRGVDVDELATSILGDFVSAEEHAIVERGDLDHRWQQYLESGETVPVEDVRAKLQGYAAEASRRMEM